jgi:hypothetical protein
MVRPSCANPDKVINKAAHATLVVTIHSTQDKTQFVRKLFYFFSLYPSLPLSLSLSLFASLSLSLSLSCILLIVYVQNRALSCPAVITTYTTNADAEEQQITKIKHISRLDTQTKHNNNNKGKYRKSRSDESHLLRNAQADGHKQADRAQNAKEPSKATILTRNANVHAKQTADQVERNQDRRDDSDLLQCIVASVTLDYLVDRDLGQVVGVCATQHLFEMGQVGHHGNDVILDIAEIQAHIAAGCYAVRLVAALCEALDNIGLATKQTQQLHDTLAAVAN